MAASKRGAKAAAVASEAEEPKATDQTAGNGGDPETETAPAAPKAKRGGAARERTAKADAKTVDLIPLNALELSEAVQPRTHIDLRVVARYAEDMRRGDRFPEIVVYRTADGHNYVADGWHRTMAAREVANDDGGAQAIMAEVREGSVRDAILYSVSVNRTHGLQRTDADKRRAVMRLLQDEEWSQWSANAIAGQVGVSQPFVSKLREQLGIGTDERTVRTQDGRVMDTSRIGRPKKARETEPVESEGEEVEGSGSADLSLLGSSVEVEAADETESAPPAAGDDVPALPDDPGVYGSSLVRHLTALARFDPSDVLRSMPEEDVNALLDGWDAAMDNLTALGEALEKMIAPGDVEAAV